MITRGACTECQAPKRLGACVERRAPKRRGASTELRDACTDRRGVDAPSVERRSVERRGACTEREYMTHKCTYLEDTRCARCPEGSYNPAKNKKQNCERCRICEGEISVRVKRSTPAKEPAAKPATPAKEPAAKPATPAKEPAAKPATPAKEPAGRIFLISCLIPAFVLLTVIICVYLLHRTWQPKKEKMSAGTSQDESLFNDESETISECRRSEEEEGPVPVQEESCKETFRCN
ncbi:UNVERIFIED_CONTAM: hypothetical protein FKN15_060684 [Acipenser sinensis]